MGLQNPARHVHRDHITACVARSISVKLHTRFRGIPHPPVDYKGEFRLA